MFGVVPVSDGHEVRARRYWLLYSDRSSIVSTSLYTISKDLGSINDGTWAILAYTLSYLGFAVIITRLSDVTGRRNAVIAAYVLFLAMSLGCGFSQSMESLIACRAIQGIGGSGLYSLAVVIMPEISPAKLLPFVSSLIGVTLAIAGVAGPLFGGIIAKNTTWRWIFWLNGPVGIVPFAVFIFAWPRKIEGYALVQQKITNIDFVGCLLMLAASVLIVFGLQEGGVGAFSWSSPVVVCTLTLGCIAALGLVVWEYIHSRKRGNELATIMPLRVITDRIMAAGILSTLLTGFCYLLVIFNLPLRFQIVNLNNPEMAGVHILPMLGATALGSALGGLASAKRNNTFFTFVVSSDSAP